MTRSETAVSLINAEDAEEIFLTILLRVRELISGEHSSMFTGSGQDFSSVRERQPDDPSKRIDWAKSTLTGFSPIIIREVIEERSADIVIVADASLSTRCGIGGVTIGHGIARAVATIGFSAAVLQDPVAQLVFSENQFGFEPFGTGKNHALRLLDIYQDSNYPAIDTAMKDIPELVSGELRRTSLVVFISDFISADMMNVCRGLVDVASSNDVVVLMIDSSFAFELPEVSSSWIGCYDAESGRHKTFSSREIKRMGAKISEHQEITAENIEKMGLEVLRVSPESDQFHDDILHFFLDRRVNKI